MLFYHRFFNTVQLNCFFVHVMMCAFLAHASIHSLTPQLNTSQWGLTADDVNSRYFASAPCCLVACIPSLLSSLPRVSALIWLHASFAPVCISIKAGCADSEVLPDPIVHVLWQGSPCWTADIRRCATKILTCSFSLISVSVL